MTPALRQAIAKVIIEPPGLEPVRGTAFLVAPGLVLTACHVVGIREQRRLHTASIRLVFPSGESLGVVEPKLFDWEADWALLSCKPLPKVRPIPLAILKRSGVEWNTHGFPDAQPVDGLVVRGEVTYHEGRYLGHEVFQLECVEAVAGNGVPVMGLSGAPCLVDGAAVGLLRASLLDGDKNVGATLYACPIQTLLARTGSRLPTPDPYWGLPGLPPRDLPARPFRYRGSSATSAPMRRSRPSCSSGGAATCARSTSG